jgi:hypothetical protein
LIVSLPPLVEVSGEAGAGEEEEAATILVLLLVIAATPSLVVIPRGDAPGPQRPCSATSVTTTTISLEVGSQVPEDHSPRVVRLACG